MDNSFLFEKNNLIKFETLFLVIFLSSGHILNLKFIFIVKLYDTSTDLLSFISI